MGALLVGGGLLLAHFDVLSRGPAYAGPLLILDHLFNVAYAVFWVALFMATGRRLLRGLGLEPSHPTDVLLFSTAAGPGLWALLFLIAGFSGLLTAPVVLGSAALAVVILRSELASLAKLGGNVVAATSRAVEGRALPWLAAAVATLVALFLFLHGTAPPGDWDSLMYHLDVPRHWLEEGRIHIPSGNLHVAYIGVLQILYVPFLALGSVAGPALLNGIFAGFLGLAVYRVGERLLDAETGLVSSVVLWASTGLLLVAITPRIDTTLAFYIVLAQGAVAGALLEPEDARGDLLRAALVMGLAAAMKYHALAFAAVLFPVGLWVLWRSVVGGRERGVVLGLAATIFLVCLVPWMVKNWVLTGAPFHPFLGPRILPPWVQELYGVAVLPSELTESVYGALGEAREPFDLVSLFVAPERLTVEPEGVHYNHSFLFLLLPLWVFHLRNRVLNVLLVPALIYCVGVTTALGTINLRYLFPALPVLTLVTTAFLVSALRRLVGDTARRGILAVVAVLVLIPTFRSAVQWTGQFSAVEQALGQVSRQEYLESGYTFYSGVAGVVNRGVPEDGRVLLVWEARGFYMAPDHLPDNILIHWPLLRLHVERTGECPTGIGITHVLASTSAARYYVSRGTNAERMDADAFRSFAERCLEPVEVGPAFGLWRMAGSESAEARSAGP